ncbi:MAG: DHA2 family efflux MFS transporter permease subunit [Corynebacterium sp.]|uniref:DHA2 family efflux MFS transporter permease subunit n=1 Tax=Corynebacterium sp. TaxID=1720 RepID=UPI003F9E20F2
MPLPPKEAWPALIALCTGFFMILLDQTIVAVATPEFQRQLHADYNEIIWVTSAYLLTFAVPLLVTGRLGDRFGPRNVYVAGMVVFTLSSLWCGLSSSVGELIAARAVQGLGAALLTPQTMAVINRIFPRERRGVALGVWGATASLSTLSGPILGGLITGTVGWEWVFFINVPIGVVSIIAVMIWVPRFRPSARRIDPLSILLSVTAVFLLVFALQEGETMDWAWWIWALMLLSLVLFAWFVRQQIVAENRGRDPLMPLSLFTVRNFSLGNIGIVGMGFAVASVPLPFTLYYQQVHGLSPLQAGLMLVPQAATSLILSPIVGRMTDRYSSRGLGTFGFTAMGVSTIGMTVVMATGVNPFWTFLPLVGLGVGNAFVWAPNSASTMRDLNFHQMGAGSGVYNQTRQLGSVVGVALVGAIMQWRLTVDDPGTAFGLAVLAPAAMMIVGVVASLMSTNNLHRSPDAAEGS